MKSFSLKPRKHFRTACKAGDGFEGIFPEGGDMVSSFVALVDQDPSYLYAFIRLLNAARAARNISYSGTSLRWTDCSNQNAHRSKFVRYFTFTAPMPSDV